MYGKKIRYFGDDTVEKQQDPGQGQEQQSQPPAEKTYTEKEFKALLTREQEKARKQHDELTQKVTALTEGLQGQSKQREELEKLLEESKRATMSAEEIRNMEWDKERKAAADHLQQITKERDDWQGRYTGMVIDGTILKAAESHEAINPAQFLALLKSGAKLVPIVQDDKPTGETQTVVSVTVNGKVLDLPVADALKAMREDKACWNLFKTKGVGGFGMEPPGNAGDGDLTKSSISDIRKELRKMKVQI